MTCLSPYCVCANLPLRGRVVRLFHDEAPRLVFRSLGGFLAAVEKATRDREEIDALADHSLGRNDQTAEDDALGRELVRVGLAMDWEETARTDVLRFAVVLLRPQSIEELSRLLDEDVYVREDVLARLRGMEGTRAAEILGGHQREMSAFVEKAVAVLRAAQLNVAEVSGSLVRLEPGAVWLDVPIWFGARGKAGVWEEIVARARQLVELER